MTPRRSLNVVVASSSVLRSEVVASALARAEDFGTVRAVQTVSETLAAMLRWRPAMLLLDVAFCADADDSIALCRQLHQSSASTAILALGEAPSLAEVRAYLAAGARGVFDTTMPLDQLRRAVVVVDEGELWISRSMVTALLRDADRPLPVPLPSAGPEVALTRREKDILGLLVEGRDHNEIAEALYVSPHTARTHIRNVMRKLDVHTRLDAVLVAIDRDLIDTEAPIVRSRPTG